jgi:hypothetical protein
VNARSTAVLPPPPAAVAAYFAQRRSSLAGFTPEDARHNEMLWLVGACGLSESEAAALMASARALEAENGGSEPVAVVPRLSKALTPDATPADNLSSHGGSGPAIAR